MYNRNIIYNRFILLQMLNVFSGSDHILYVVITENFLDFDTRTLLNTIDLNVAFTYYTDNAYTIIMKTT